MQNISQALVEYMLAALDVNGYYVYLSLWADTLHNMRLTCFYILIPNCLERNSK